MKRPSSHQITKDDPDHAEEQPEIVDGFQKASADVLAARRIVKARRSFPAGQVPASDDAPKAPNPFARLSLPTASVAPKPDSAAPAIAPASTAPVAPAVSAETADPTQNGNGTPAQAPKDNPEETKDAALPTTASQPESAAPAEKAEDEKKEAEKQKDAEKTAEAVKKDDAEQKPEEPKQPASQPAAEPNDSEKPISVAKEAPPPSTKAEDPKPGPPAAPAEEKTAAPVAEAPKEPVTNGAAPAPFIVDGKPAPTDAPVNALSAAEVEKKLAAKQKVSENTNGNTAKKPFVFGGSATAPTFANAAAAEGTFNFSAAAPAPAPVKTPQKEFKEAHVETGEEHDREMFRARAKLYSLDIQDGKGRWRERGVGSLKLNKNLETGKVRMLMRTEATLRVVLNTPVFPEFKLDRATERSLRFQGYDVDDTDGKNRTSFLIRFSTRDITSGLVEAIDKWKQGEDNK